MITAIFPAAGQGRRMGAAKNKVLLPLLGVPILLRTLQKFSAHAEIDALIVVAAAEDMGDIGTLLAAADGLKPYKLVAGGSERQYSVQNGLAALAPECDIVLVHDAARPLVSEETISAVIAAAKSYGAAIAAVPEKNTVKVASPEGFVTATPDRALLWAAQTPQGFRRETITAANDLAQADGFLGTDDASLVERLGGAVKLVASDYRNLKITTPEDMRIAEALLMATTD